jgi:hypothetical protein
MNLGLSRKTWIWVGLDIVGFAAILWTMEEVRPLGIPNVALLSLCLSSIILIAATVFFLPAHLANFKRSVDKVLGIYGVALLMYPLVIGINVRFDSTLMIHQRLPVRQKFPSAIKGETYLVSFFLPQTRANVFGVQNIEIKKYEYDRVDTTDTYIHLELKEGAVGIPWIEGYYLEFPPKRK